MPPPIVIQPRREVSALERYMPYIVQMGQARKARKFQEKQAVEARQFQIDQEQAKINRIKNFRPNMMTYMIENPATGKKEPVTGFLDPQGKFNVHKFNKPASPNYQTITLRPPGAKDAKTDFTIRRNDPRLNQILEKGATEVRTPGASVTIKQGSDITAGTKTKLEKEYVEAQDLVKSLNQISMDYSEEYTSFWGQSKAALGAFMDKAGIASADQKTYLDKYHTWKTGTEAVKFAYRKSITGVAGGEKEMKAIEKSVINPGDAPSVFQSKLRVMRRNATKLMERRKWARDNFGKEIEALTEPEADRLRKVMPLEHYNDSAASFLKDIFGR